jgi:hypothetical protein
MALCIAHPLMVVNGTKVPGGLFRRSRFSPSSEITPRELRTVGEAKSWLLFAHQMDMPPETSIR